MFGIFRLFGYGRVGVWCNGGATQSAIQNFQLNYGLNISEQVEFYGKWFIEIDDITYLTIANVAANHGFYVGDKPVEAHTEYKMLCNLTAEGYGKTFFDYIPSVVPILNIEQINNDISIYSDINGKFDTVYYLDYTEPLKNIITDMTNAAESFIYYPSFNGYVQFYTNVNHGGIWDVKVRKVGIIRYQLFIIFLRVSNLYIMILL